MPLMKKEDEFFGLLRTVAGTLVEAAEEYAAIFREYPESAVRIPRMKQFEITCDDQVGEIMRQLYTSFITPFDREDISALALSMDDVMDFMETTAARLELFNVLEMRPEAVEMAELTRQAVHEVYDMIDHLSEFRKDSTVMEKAGAIDQLDDNADTVYRNSLRMLFLEDTGGKETLKWLRVFDRMEHCSHSCDHIAAVVRNIVLKSA